MNIIPPRYQQCTSTTNHLHPVVWRSNRIFVQLTKGWWALPSSIVFARKGKNLKFWSEQSPTVGLHNITPSDCKYSRPTSQNYMPTLQHNIFKKPNCHFTKIVHVMPLLSSGPPCNTSMHPSLPVRLYSGMPVRILFRCHHSAVILFCFFGCWCKHHFRKITG